jgi:hypothetical protein
MTLAAITDGRLGRVKAAARRVLLSRDDSGSWTLSGLNRPSSRFADFAAALERARDVQDAQAATIEVWQGGDYICCLQPAEWPKGGASNRLVPTVSERRHFTAAERYANRVGQVLMATAGPLFWLALMLAGVAASLGWRLLLL